MSYTDPSYTDLFYTSQPPSQTLKTFASWSAKQLPALTLRACVDAAVVEAIGVSVCEGWDFGEVHCHWVLGCGSLWCWCWYLVGITDGIEVGESMLHLVLCLLVWVKRWIAWVSLRKVEIRRYGSMFRWDDTRHNSGNID